MDDGTPGSYERLVRRQRPAAAGKPRPSAAIVPWRRGPAGETEVYWVRRSKTMRFLGGWYAFPGGGLAASDAAVAVAEPPVGTSYSTFSSAEPEADEAGRRRLGPDLFPGLAACAVRELFEETGLLLASEVRRGVAGATPDDLAAARRRLLAKEVGFAELMAERGWSASAGRLVFAGRWVTPPLAPLRFDNRFFLLEWHRERALQPTLMGTELDRGEWIRPADALARWRRGEVLVAPPILHILAVLASDGPAAGLPRLENTEEANLGPFRRLELVPGVILLPLLTHTLPPATHTNAYLLGRRRAVLVDPATPLPEEIERLGRALRAARAQGIEVSAIWLTHHHPDHVGAAAAMRRELGVPICAHPLAAQPLRQAGVAVDEELTDGQRVDLGDGEPFPMQVLHTPGHTRGHLSFYAETSRALIAGDLASTLSTIVIDPPEGDMDAYLTSLDRVIALAPDLLFPAHGPAVLGAVRRLEKLKRHRLEREEQVLAAWRAGQRQPAEMVPGVYSDLAPEIHPVAERQITAHLDRLRRQGRVSSS